MYDPTLARFVSADSVVPGSASGGMDGVALKGLTVAFHEPGFVGTLNRESAQPFWFQLSDDAKQQVGEPWGPQEAQALNRYSYVQNNSVRWTDPSGHFAGVLVLPLIAITAPAWVVPVAIVVGVVALAAGIAYVASEIRSNRGRYAGDKRTAGEIINKEKKGGINSEFPAEYKDKTPDEIYKDTQAGKTAAQTAKKLLDSKEYDKDAKK